MAKKPKKTAAEKKAERDHRDEVRFAGLYVSNGRNAALAYRTMRPSCSDASSHVLGSRWLSRVNVQDEIAKLTAEVFKREHMTAEEALAIVARRARLNIDEFYWQPGQLDREGNATRPGTRKPLSELTPSQAQCVAGFKPTQFGTEMKFHSADTNMGYVLKAHKLLTDKVDMNVTTPLDKLLEQSYGQEQA